jgi:hypothetical protein
MCCSYALYGAKKQRQFGQLSAAGFATFCSKNVVFWKEFKGA